MADPTTTTTTTSPHSESASPPSTAATTPPPSSPILKSTSTTTVTVYPLHAGTFTLPLSSFIDPVPTPGARKAVPSLSFLIQHVEPPSPAFPQGKTTKIVFDLGLRNPQEDYSAPIRTHITTRQPMLTSPSVVESLAAGGLTPNDIDVVILSHLHWDHIGNPGEFGKSVFVVGAGGLGLLDGTRKMGNGSHSHFEADLLPRDRTVELPDPEGEGADAGVVSPLGSEDGGDGRGMKGIGGLNLRHWRPLHLFPHSMDLFGDGSVYVISAPGHLPGHINLLCRVSSSPDKYMLLAADACHDRRLLTGACRIAIWEAKDQEGVTHKQCIHVDPEQAKETMERIRRVEAWEVEELGGVEVVFAHDDLWAERASREGRFFGQKSN